MNMKDILGSLSWGMRGFVSLIFLGILAVMILLIPVILMDMWNNGTLIPILIISICCSVLIFYGLLFLLDTLIKLCDFLLEKEKNYLRKKRLKSLK